MSTTFTDEQLSLDDTTAVATTNAKTASGGKTAQKMIVHCSAETRMRVGANPTSAIGIVLNANTIYEFTGYDFIDDVRFIATASAGSTVDIQYILL